MGGYEGVKRVRQRYMRSAYVEGGGSPALVVEAGPAVARELRSPVRVAVRAVGGVPGDAGTPDLVPTPPLPLLLCGWVLG